MGASKSRVAKSRWEASLCCELRTCLRHATNIPSHCIGVNVKMLTCVISLSRQIHDIPVHHITSVFFERASYRTTPHHINNILGHGGSLVDSSPFVRRNVGSNSALAAT